MMGIRHFVCLTLTGGLLLLQPTAARSADLDALVKLCESCHGEGGNSRIPIFPSIAGYSYESFLDKMITYRENERIAEEFQRSGEPETVMSNMARRLSGEEAAALATYFSAQKFVPVQQPVDRQLARQGEILHQEKCERCHSRNGAVPAGDASILAGQWTQYLRLQFQNIASGKRIASASMRRRLKKLSENEIEALLNFYASVGMQ